MLDWWIELPWWLRAGVALAFLAASTILWYAGWFWPWGWGIGVVLLMFSFPSANERKGYRGM